MTTWTNEEVQLIKDFYAIEGKDIINRFNNRSINSISKKANRLGIKSNNNYPLGWSKEEIQILKEFYPTEGKSIKNRLNRRTEATIQVKASSLGIYCTNPYTTKCTNTTFDIKNTTKYIRIGDYLNNSTPILFKCPECDNTWKTTPSKILSNRGCPSCSKTGFNPNIGAYLYFIKINTPHDCFLKVGITNKIPTLRYKEFKGIVTEILTIRGNGSSIYNLEQKIHNNFRHYIPADKFSGYTECFGLDLKDIILEYLNGSNFPIHTGQGI